MLPVWFSYRRYASTGIILSNGGKILKDVVDRHPQARFERFGRDAGRVRRQDHVGQARQGMAVGKRLRSIDIETRAGDLSLAQVGIRRR